MESTEIRIGRFMWRATAAHMVAYFLAGIFALFTLQYEERFATGLSSAIMRPVDSPIVSFGASLQAIMGIALSLILYQFRRTIIDGARGWAKLFFLIAGLAIFAPQVVGAGTFEGLIYTKFSAIDHLASLPETLAYSLLFSTFLCGWFAKPRKAWNIIAGIAVGLIAVFSLLGFMDSQGMLPTQP